MFVYKAEQENNGTNRNLLVSEASEIVAQKVEGIWKSASIPIVSHQRIVSLIKEYQKKRKDLLKPYLKRKDVASYKSKLDVFKKDSLRLFDIAACKCENFNSCSCLKQNKVPIKERPFLQDQRSCRQMMIASVDFEAVRQQQKREMRSKCDKGNNIIDDAKPSTSSYNRQVDGMELEVEPVFNNIDEYEVSQPEEKKEQSAVISDEQTILQPTKRNTRNLSELAKTLDRYAVSDRAGAAIASAVLQDYGIVNNEDTQNIIDRHKVRRARQQNRVDLQRFSKSTILLGLYFDGCKDKTLTFDENRKTTIVEEHISLIQEPDSKYLGHVSPISGTAANILDAFNNFFQISSISLDSLEVIGCDGT
uniref:Uncharacterized protein LOC114325406 n=1 Tax=Diabrotica virgifera virgifera TaxID=50390 RepID=A0A6P7F767_DIAVI